MSLDLLLGPRGNLFSGQREPTRQIRLETPLLSEADLWRTPSERAARRDALALADVSRGAGWRGLRTGARGPAPLRRPRRREGSLAASSRTAAWAPAGQPCRPCSPPLPSIRSCCGAAPGRGRASSSRRARRATNTRSRPSSPSAPRPSVPIWRSSGPRRSGGGPDSAGNGDAAKRYLLTLERGLAKILSKMGISTLSSYQGACLFEALGLAGSCRSVFPRRRVPDRRHRASAEIAAEVLRAARRRASAAGTAALLEQGGLHGFRRDGERHAFCPDVVQGAPRRGPKRRAARYRELRRARASREPLAAAGPAELAPPPGAASRSRRSSPWRRSCAAFIAAAMSLGAFSPEAHETLAVA